jgi:nucleoside-diphosphate-sugar epimerase
MQTSMQSRGLTKPSVLVAGGAGYIGSHVVLALHSKGWPVETTR